MRKFNKSNPWHWTIAVLFAAGLVLAAPAILSGLFHLDVRAVPYVLAPMLPFLVALTSFRNLGGYDDLTVYEMASTAKRYFWRAGMALFLVYLMRWVVHGSPVQPATELLLWTMVRGWFVCAILGLFCRKPAKKRTRNSNIPKMNLYPGTRPRQYPDGFDIYPKV